MVFQDHCAMMTPDTRTNIYLKLNLSFMQTFHYPGFAGAVPIFGRLFQCPRLNQFFPVFIFFTKKTFRIHLIFHQQCKKLPK